MPNDRAFALLRYVLLLVGGSTLWCVVAIPRLPLGSLPKLVLELAVIGVLMISVRLWWVWCWPDRALDLIRQHRQGDWRWSLKQLNRLPNHMAILYDVRVWRFATAYRDLLTAIAQRRVL